MLVLARRKGEEIVINGDIRIKIVRIQGECVRLGIEAPPYVSVDRLEIHEKRCARAEFVPAGLVPNRCLEPVQVCHS